MEKTTSNHYINNTALLIEFLRGKLSPSESKKIREAIEKDELLKMMVEGLKIGLELESTDKTLESQFNQSKAALFQTLGIDSGEKGDLPANKKEILSPWTALLLCLVLILCPSQSKTFKGMEVEHEELSKKVDYKRPVMAFGEGNSNIGDQVKSRMNGNCVGWMTSYLDVLQLQNLDFTFDRLIMEPDGENNDFVVDPNHNSVFYAGHGTNLDNEQHPSSTKREANQVKRPVAAAKSVTPDPPPPHISPSSYHTDSTQLFFPPPPNRQGTAMSETQAEGLNHSIDRHPTGSLTINNNELLEPLPEYPSFSTMDGSIISDLYYNSANRLINPMFRTENDVDFYNAQLSTEQLIAYQRLLAKKENVLKINAAIDRVDQESEVIQYQIATVNKLYREELSNSLDDQNLVIIRQLKDELYQLKKKSEEIETKREVLVLHLPYTGDTQLANSVFNGNQRIGATQELSNEDRYEFDPYGNLKTIKSANGDKTTYEYESSLALIDKLSELLDQMQGDELKKKNLVTSKEEWLSQNKAQVKTFNRIKKLVKSGSIQHFNNFFKNENHLVLLSACHSSKKEIRSYAKLINRYAKEEEKRTNIPKRIIIRYSFIKSEFGKSEAITKANNYFDQAAKIYYAISDTLSNYQCELVELDSKKGELILKFENPVYSFKINSDYLLSSPKIKNLAANQSKDMDEWIYNIAQYDQEEPYLGVLMASTFDNADIGPPKDQR